MVRKRCLRKGKEQVESVTGGYQKNNLEALDEVKELITRKR